MMKLKTLLFIFLIPIVVLAQEVEHSISLGYVHQQIEATYPLMRKVEVQEKITAINDQIIRSGLLPEIQVGASASYQSEVTEIPFSAPGSPATQLSKDLYNVSMDITQSLYDGGMTSARRKLEAGESRIEDASVEVSLWDIRRQAEEVYFGILNLKKQQESIELLIKDIEEQWTSVQSKIENGVLLPANGVVLEAEILKVRQRNIQVQYEMEAAYSVLGKLIGEEIQPETKLEEPEVRSEFLNSSEVLRPELKLFDSRINTLGLQKKLADTDRHPKISAFAKGSYGRPGFNVFDDDLHPYWMLGLKAQWSFRSWTNADKKTEVLELQKKKIQADEQSFLIGVEAELNKIEKRIEQIQEQIKLDEKILNLRGQVVDEKKNQLEQGVITTTEYLTELNAEAQARLSLEIRRLQLIQNQVEYLTKKGISWN